jgi:hypothetical protein
MYGTTGAFFSISRSYRLQRPDGIDKGMREDVANRLFGKGVTK